MTDSNSLMYDFAERFVKNTNRNIFITGKAGTGKTTFLHRLKEHTGKQTAVLAPTGVAAINAGGSTIHSFFQLPFSPFIPTTEGKKEFVSKIKMKNRSRRIIQKLELIVIDEVSMVRVDIMDAIDTILRSVRHRQNELFGGVQMIFMGDMYQLSPVVKETERYILSQFYKGIYFFHSVAIQQQRPIHIEFEKVFRQTDIKFISLLNNIRNNTLNNDDLSVLDSCYLPNFVPAKDDTYITLTTHNYKADSINEEELSKIEAPIVRFRATTKGDFPEKNFPVDEMLVLKIGAKVMFVKNDSESPRRFYNGKIGEIIDIEDETILVKCSGEDDDIEVKRMDWHNISYTIDENTQNINEEILGIFRQFPLRLAWAITIHKSQGLTFEKAIVDTEDAFAAGQVYVALSRCRSLQGLILSSKINKESIRNDENIVAFSSGKENEEQLGKKLSKSEKEYFNQLLLSIYDFNPLLNTVKKLCNTCKKGDTHIDDEAVNFAQNIVTQAANIHGVGINFQNQLQKIVQGSSYDRDFLHQRLGAAATFFFEKISLVVDTLKEMPATTDNKKTARIYDDDMLDIFTVCEQKKYLIQGIKDNFDIKIYSDLNNNFKLPSWNFTIYSRTTPASVSKSLHPKLMHLLFQLRNNIADETHLPIYLVAGSKTISDMSDYLPQNKKELLLIKGFGEKKYERFGELFLDCIRNYCSLHHIQSNMHLLAEKPTHKHEKKSPRGSSANDSLILYQQGIDIQTIANQRNITQGTVAGHLSRFVQDGTLQLEQFISTERLETMYKALQSKEPSASAFSFLKETGFSEVEVKIGLDYLRNTKSESEI